VIRAFIASEDKCTQIRNNKFRNTRHQVRTRRTSTGRIVCVLARASDPPPPAYWQTSSRRNWELACVHTDLYSVDFVYWKYILEIRLWMIVV